MENRSLRPLKYAIGPRMKLGSVPYLNALPLTTGISYPIQRVIPRKLLTLLQKGEVDLALLSTVTVFENSEFYLIPGMGIGCRGPVASVKLFFNKPGLTIQDLKSFKQSPESNTANMLARLLFPQAQSRPAMDADAEVVIGDAAMTRPDPHGSVDLGELWWQRTGLPFVFAAWISRHPQISRTLWDDLMAAKTRNLDTLDACIAASPLLPELSLAAKREYLRHNIHFDLGDLEMAGMQKFREECIRSELLPNAQPIRIAEIIS